MTISTKEKTFWRIAASLQEILRVSDEDIAQNSDLEKVIHQFANIALLYRATGAGPILEAHHERTNKLFGIPVIKAKKV